VIFINNIGIFCEVKPRQSRSRNHTNRKNTGNHGNKDNSSTYKHAGNTVRKAILAALITKVVINVKCLFFFCPILAKIKFRQQNVVTKFTKIVSLESRSHENGLTGRRMDTLK
jgi:hypothetical protein